MYAIRSYYDNFYLNNGGTGTDPDIYSALYYAVKMLNGEDFSALTGHGDNVRSIVTSQDLSYFYSASSDGSIFRWMPNGKNMDKKKIWDSERLVHITTSLSSDGKFFVAAGNYPYLLLFNNSNIDAEPQRIKLKNSQTVFSKFTPKNNAIVFVSSTNKVMLYNFNTITERNNFV